MWYCRSAEAASFHGKEINNKATSGFPITTKKAKIKQRRKKKKQKQRDQQQLDETTIRRTAPHVRRVGRVASRTSGFSWGSEGSSYQIKAAQARCYERQAHNRRVQRSRLKQFLVQCDLKEIFAKWDRNGNESLDEHELFWGLELEDMSLLKENFQGVFAEMDENHDGKVTFEELSNFVQRWAPHRGDDATHGLTIKRTREARHKEAPRRRHELGTISLPEIAYRNKYRSSEL